MKFLSVFLCLFGLSLSGKLPSDYKTCKRTDPNINVCLLEAIQDAYPRLAKGIPSIDVAELEPLTVPSLIIEAGKGPVNVVQKYTNVNIFNLINAKVDKVEASVNDPFKLTLEISASEYRLEADYDFNGRILLLPIVGQGKCTIKLINPKSVLVLTGEKIEKKGKTHVMIKDFQVMLNPEKVTFNFENLFNGDKRLGPEMNNVLNENWKGVFADVKSGYEEFLGTIGKHVANSIFTKVPYDELFPQ